MHKDNILKHVIQSLRTVVREQGGERATFQAVLSIPVMKAYLADYFSRDFLSQAQNIEKNHGRPTPSPEAFGGNPHKILANDGGYWETMNDKAVFVQDSVRSYTVYPLTAQALNLANQNLDATPALSMAFAGLQAGVASYLGDVLLAVQEMQSQIETDDPEGHITDEDYALSAVETAVTKMSENANGFSFMHDLLPVIASQLENAGEFQGDDIRKGLVFAFQRSAFKSYDAASSAQTVTRCPFSRAIAHLADTVLEKDDGAGLVIAERTEPGALLVFIAKRLGEISAQRPLQNDSGTTVCDGSGFNPAGLWPCSCFRP